MSPAAHDPSAPDPLDATPFERATLPRTRATDRMVRTTLSQVLSENHGGSWLVRSEREALTAPRKVARNITGGDDDRPLVDRHALAAEQDHGADRAA